MTATLQRSAGSPVIERPAAPHRRAPRDTRPPRRTGRGHLAPWTFFAVALSAVAVRTVQDGAWEGGYFLDEQWRVDFIRAADPVDRMLSHDTPVPVGWVYAMKALSPFGHDPVLFRLVVAATYVLAAGVLALLLLRIAQRGPIGERGRIPPVVAAGAVGLLAFAPAVSHPYHYVSNYPAEVLYVALAVLAAEELGRHRLAPRALACLLVLAPLFVVGGMLVVPSLLACLGWWAWTSEPERRRRRLAWAGATAAATATTSTTIFLWLVRPVTSRPSIGDYWVGSGDSLGGEASVVDLVRQTVGAASSTLGGDHPAMAALLAGGFVVGVVSVARRWPALLAVVASSYGLAIVASALAHWPMTLQRVNLCFTILALALVWFGVLRTVAWVLPALDGWAVVPALLVLLGVTWPTPWGFDDAYARGLRADLLAIVPHAAPTNVVLSYHRFSHFYAHDALVNEHHDGVTFALEFESWDDPTTIYTDPGALVARHDLAPGDMVWCVMPWMMGDSIDDACQLDGLDVWESVTIEGTDALVRGFVVLGGA
jgi:hypothetical protein